MVNLDAAGAQRIAELCTDEMWSADRASQSLGMQVVSVSPGMATLRMTVRDDMVNGWGICHGGFITAVADSAFAVACNTRGVVTVAASIDVTFLEPARLGDELVATARETVLRGRNGVYDVDVARDGEVIATLRGRSRSTSKPNPALSELDPDAQ